MFFLFLQKNIMGIDDKCLSDNMHNCDFVKTLLMLCVVVGHCCGFWTNAWFPVIKPTYSNAFLGIFANWLGSFHVACFTLVSGYIFYYVKNERKGKYSLRITIVKKIRRLLFPYVFVCLFWVIPINNIFFNYSVLDILQNFILGCGAEQLWFLLMLFNVFILFNLFSPLFRLNGFIVFAFLFILYIVGDSLSRKSIINVFQIFTSLKYLVFFTTGYYMRKHFKLLLGRNLINLSNGWLILLLFLVNYVLSVYLCDSGLFDCVFYRIVSKLIGVAVNVNKAILAFAILLYIADRTSWQSKCFSVLKSNNFNMYLFHQQIVYVMLYLFNGLFIPEIHALFNFLVSFSLSLLLSIVIRKNRVLRICLGEK